jgi:hypothetical protein
MRSSDDVTKNLKFGADLLPLSRGPIISEPMNTNSRSVLETIAMDTGGSGRLKTFLIDLPLTMIRQIRSGTCHYRQCGAKPFANRTRTEFARHWTLHMMDSKLASLSVGYYCRLNWPLIFHARHNLREAGREIRVRTIDCFAFLNIIIFH